MNTPLLETRNLRVTVADRVLCDHLDLRLLAGQVWSILGRNGAGKTSLLHTLAGLRTPAGGEVLVAGQLLTQLDRRTIARRLGILFQDHYDPFPATVMETALTGRHPHIGALGWESARDHELAGAALDSVDLQGMQDRDTATLSGGERRRLGIATLLTQQPDIYLWDEPTNHLDLHHQIQFLSRLQALAQRDRGLHVMVLHDINLAARFSDHVLLMKEDGAYLAGPRDEVLHQASLETIFGHPLVETTTPRGKAWLPE